MPLSVALRRPLVPPPRPQRNAALSRAETPLDFGPSALDGPGLAFLAYRDVRRLRAVRAAQGNCDRRAGDRCTDSLDVDLLNRRAEPSARRSDHVLRRADSREQYDQGPIFESRARG